MNYNVIVSSKAKQDLIEAINYIEHTLLNPKAAEALLDLVEEKISNLSFMPTKYKIVDDTVLASYEIRMIVINNYLVFYTVNTALRNVNIIRFLYGKRDWISVLKTDYIV